MYRVSIIELETCEPPVAKTMQRNCVKMGEWQNEMMGILSREKKKKNNEFQKSPLGVVT